MFQTEMFLNYHTATRQHRSYVRKCTIFDVLPVTPNFANWRDANNTRSLNPKLTQPEMVWEQTCADTGCQQAIFF